MTLATERKDDEQKVALRALAGHAALTLSSGAHRDLVDIVEDLSKEASLACRARRLYLTGNGSRIKRKGTRA